MNSTDDQSFLVAEAPIEVPLPSGTEKSSEKEEKKEEEKEEEMVEEKEEEIGEEQEEEKEEEKGEEKGDTLELKVGETSLQTNAPDCEEDSADDAGDKIEGNRVKLPPLSEYGPHNPRRSQRHRRPPNYFRY